MFSISSIIQKISILYLFFNINIIYAYEGDGTFYGGDATLQGTNACMLRPNFNGVPNTVAINRPQFENGAACGKCVEVSLELDSRGQPIGLGVKPLPFKIIATIDNECPECSGQNGKYDIDFGFINFGENFDGRWKIQWDFIPCPNGNPNQHVLSKNESIGNLLKLKKNNTDDDDDMIFDDPTTLDLDVHNPHRNLRIDSSSKLTLTSINGSEILTILVLVFAVLLIVVLIVFIIRLCKNRCN